ncbi:MAG: hypothetical protein HAW61_02505 [Candidatus Portiera sp.]|nr:hypothetical protein [Portiera sp.]
MTDSKNNPPPWKWRAISKQHEDRPSHLNTKDNCGFLGDRYKWNLPQAGELSKKIENFKKGIDRKGKSDWTHRNKAIEAFAWHIEMFLNNNSKLLSSLCLMAVPSSKHPDDPSYDRRFEDLFDELNKIMTQPVTIKTPIIVKESTKPVHKGGERNPIAIANNYVWQEKETLSGIQNLVVCDDVITTGAHFRAVSDFLRKKGYKNQITGLFFGRHRWPDPTEDFKVLPEVEEGG